MKGAAREHAMPCALRATANACHAVQGNLPTFLDVGESFSAATMAEDNLLTQMSNHGMKVVGHVLPACRIQSCRTQRSPHRLTQCL